ncbi:nSTAND1 domain-containing NTPase [Micromonospora deserti]|uniref:HTH cro/C1-type domain-containing protein n=1 Tax=Micromonospora deserti TaxID=2070366 RepID=A0A2W2CW48_9ACTN|nr:helix-turn-helix domain-containing protein [Micromonospora deserti]PZG02151.1 hypothetical protein C1I99_03955 [Micromonospora deserti]
MADDLADSDNQSAEPTNFVTAADLGAALLKLKQRSGRSLRQLADASGLGFSTINGYCKGRHLPQQGIGKEFRALLRALGVTTDEELDAWVVAADRLRRGAKTVDAANPYPGLRPFGTDEARFFFGRAALTRELFDRVAGQAVVGGPLVVVGPSGAGKSSLIRAGLIPAAAGDGWSPLLLTPGKSPLHALAEAYAPECGGSAQELHAELTADPAASARFARRAGRRVLIVVDQLEEIFATEVDDAQRRMLLAALAAASDSSGGDGKPQVAVVVLGLRADFYDRALRLPELAASLRRAQLIVPPMTEAELREAITGPVQGTGCTIDGALVERLVRDVAPPGGHRTGVAHEPGALPMLCHALRGTYVHATEGRSSGGVLSIDSYLATGGLAGAIARTADSVYDGLTPAQQQVARRLFLSMVHVDVEITGIAHTRRRLDLDALFSARSDAETDDLAEVLDTFVTHRLLTADAETVEISHESLLVQWPRLRAWIDEAREGLRVHRLVCERARTWTAGGRDAAELARGPRLEAMEPLLDDAGAGPALLSNDEREFLTASVRARRRRNLRLRLLAIVMTALALLATAFAGLFAAARQDAAAARDEALSRQMAVTARQLATDDPGIAVQLAIAGFRIAPTADARSALLDLAADGVSARYQGGTGYPALAVSGSGSLVAVSDAQEAATTLYRPSDSTLEPAGRIELAGGGLDSWESYALALTPAGDILAAQDTTNRIALWDVADPARPQRLGTLSGPENVQHLAINPDGTELAAVGETDNVHRWNISDATAPAELPPIAAAGSLRSIAYGPRGDLLAFGNDTAVVELWDLTGKPNPIAELAGGQGRVSTVSFSPDGHLLAAGTMFGRTVSAWDITDPAEPEQLEVTDSKFDSWVNAGAFSPDGTLFVAATSESVVRVWDTDTWETRADLPHPNVVWRASFTNDSTLVTATLDGTTRVWDLNARIPTQLSGRVFSTKFASQSGDLAAFSENEATVWKLDGSSTSLDEPVHVIVDHDLQSIGNGDIAPDGSLLARSYTTGDVRLFDLAEPGKTKPASTFGADTDGLVQNMAFSPDGRLLATGGDDSQLRLFDVTDPRRPRKIATADEPDGAVLGLTWNADQTLLAAAAADQRVHLYDVTNPGEPRRIAVLDGFDRDPRWGAFSPDSGLLAVAGGEGVIKLWDISDPRDPTPVGRPITEPVNEVPELVFLPDGTTVAATDANGTLRLFDVTDPRAPSRYAALTPSAGPVHALDIHPGGELLAASSIAGAVHLWHLNVDTVTDRVCATIGDPITEQEWRTHLPDIPYQPPCPTR